MICNSTSKNQEQSSPRYRLPADPVLLCTSSIFNSVTNPVELTLLVPCLNEGPNVHGTLESINRAAVLSQKSFEILVVDDGSTDDTSDQVTEFIRRHPQVPVALYSNPTNLGLARTYANMAFLGRGLYYRICCGDDVEPAETLVKIFSAAGLADVIAPFQPDVPRPWGRLALSRAFTFLINTLSGHRLHYYNGCPLILTRHVQRWHSHSSGFGFQADTLARLLDEGASVIEFAVEVRDRPQGVSKAITVSNFLSVAHLLTALVVRRFSRKFLGRKSIVQRRAALTVDDETLSSMGTMATGVK
jgi:glycosyltransferase involved in cell wall biosynthesis